MPAESLRLCQPCRTLVHILSLSHLHVVLGSDLHSCHLPEVPQTQAITEFFRGSAGKLFHACKLAQMRGCLKLFEFAAYLSAVLQDCWALFLRWYAQL